MTEYALDKRYKAWWVPGAAGITNIAAPTVAEIGAGTDITPFLPRDGFDPGISPSRVDNGDLVTGIDRTVPGSRAASPTVKGKRHIATADDDFWALVVLDTVGFIVERRGELYTAAVAAAQEVSVYSGIWDDPVPMATASNAVDTFTAPFHCQDYRVKAIVAA